MPKISFSELLYFSKDIREQIFSEGRKVIKVNTITGKLKEPDVPKADPTETATSEPDPEATQPIVLNPAVEIAKKTKADFEAEEVKKKKEPQDLEAEMYTAVKAKVNKAAAATTSETPSTTSATATATTPAPPTAPMASGGTKPPAVSPPATAPSGSPAWQMSKGGVKLNKKSKLRVKDITQVSAGSNDTLAKNSPLRKWQDNIDPNTGRPKGMPSPNPVFSTPSEDDLAGYWSDRTKGIKDQESRTKASQKSIERHQRKEEKRKIAFDRSFKRAESDKERAQTKGTKQAWKGFDRDAATAAKAAAEVTDFEAEKEKKKKETQDQEAEMYAARKSEKEKKKTSDYEDARAQVGARQTGHNAGEIAIQKKKAADEKRAMVDNPNLALPEPVDPAVIAADLSAYGTDKAKKDTEQKQRVFDRVVGVEKDRLQQILAQTKQKEKQVKRAVKFGRRATHGIGRVIGRTARLGQNVATQMSHPSTVSFNFRHY